MSSGRGTAVSDFFRLSSIVFGAILAALGGLNSFVGFDVPDDTLRQLPGYLLIAANPGIAVAVGLTIILVALVAPAGERGPRGWT